MTTKAIIFRFARVAYHLYFVRKALPKLVGVSSMFRIYYFSPKIGGRIGTGGTDTQGGKQSKGNATA